MVTLFMCVASNVVFAGCLAVFATALTESGGTRTSLMRCGCWCSSSLLLRPSFTFQWTGSISGESMQSNRAIARGHAPSGPLSPDGWFLVAAPQSPSLLASDRDEAPGHNGVIDIMWHSLLANWLQWAWQRGASGQYVFITQTCAGTGATSVACRQSSTGPHPCRECGATRSANRIGEMPTAESDCCPCLSLCYARHEESNGGASDAVACGIEPRPSRFSVRPRTGPHSPP